MKFHQFLKKCDEDWKPLPKERMERQARKKQDNLGTPGVPINKRAETMSQIKTMDATRNFLGSIMPQLFPEPNKKDFPAQKVYSKYMADVDKIQRPEDYSRVRAMNQVHRLDYQGNKPGRRGERERQAEYNMADRMMKRTQSVERAADALAGQKASLERLLDPDVAEALTELPKLQREKLIDPLEGTLSKTGGLNGLAEMLLKTLDNRRSGKGEYDDNETPNRMMYALLNATEDNSFARIDGVMSDMMREMNPALRDIFGQEGDLEELIGVSEEEFEQAFGMPFSSIAPALDEDFETYEGDDLLPQFQLMQQVMDMAGDTYNRRNQDNFDLHRANNEMADEMTRSRIEKVLKEISNQTLDKFQADLKADEEEGFEETIDEEGNEQLTSRANPLLLKLLHHGLEYDDVRAMLDGWSTEDGSSYLDMFDSIDYNDWENHRRISGALEGKVEEYMADYARTQVEHEMGPFGLLNFDGWDYKYGPDKESSQAQLEEVFDTLIKQGGGRLPDNAVNILRYLLDPNDEGKYTYAFSRDSAEDIVPQLLYKHLQDGWFQRTKDRPKPNVKQDDEDHELSKMGEVMEMIEPMLTSGQPRTPELEAMLNFDGSEEQYGQVFPEEIRKRFEHYMLEGDLDNMMDELMGAEEEKDGWDATLEDRFQGIPGALRSLALREGRDQNAFPSLKGLQDSGMMDLLKQMIVRKLDGDEEIGGNFRGNAMRHLAELMQRLRGMYPSE